MIYHIAQRYQVVNFITINRIVKSTNFQATNQIVSFIEKW